MWEPHPLAPHGEPEFNMPVKLWAPVRPKVESVENNETLPVMVGPASSSVSLDEMVERGPELTAGGATSVEIPTEGPLAASRGS